MVNSLVSGKKTMLFASIFVSSIFFTTAFTAMAQEQNNAVFSVAKSKTKLHAGDWRSRDSVRIQRNWGIDIVGVRPVSTGFMLAFRYRIVDAGKAKVLNDKRSKAYLIDEATGNTLGVPNMENLGELRQKDAPELNRVYFIMFGNPGKLVKSGSHVSVVVGDFRVDNLVVD
jgi:hypothetical protein